MVRWRDSSSATMLRPRSDQRAIRSILKRRSRSEMTSIMSKAGSYLVRLALMAMTVELLSVVNTTWQFGPFRRKDSRSTTSRGCISLANEGQGAWAFVQGAWNMTTSGGGVAVGGTR